MADPRVRELLDFSLYLDITDDVKFAWKIQRDMVERGHRSSRSSSPSKRASPTSTRSSRRSAATPTSSSRCCRRDLIPDEKEGKVLKVKFIQKEGKANFDPAYLFDEEARRSSGRPAARS